jgi:hypothetical protein
MINDLFGTALSWGGAPHARGQALGKAMVKTHIQYPPDLFGGKEFVAGVL